MWKILNYNKVFHSFNKDSLIHWNIKILYFPLDLERVAIYKNQDIRNKIEIKSFIVNTKSSSKEENY